EVGSRSAIGGDMDIVGSVQQGGGQRGGSDIYLTTTAVIVFPHGVNLCIKSRPDRRGDYSELEKRDEFTGKGYLKLIEGDDDGSPLNEELAGRTGEKAIGARGELVEFIAIVGRWGVSRPPEITFLNA
ncbi:hypothetical protein KAR91_72335, partial [Candidatus Pacearchaeota archaeon]|nr:hypothetical protein [Candidatus Pacearchaeota archaeon]